MSPKIYVIFNPAAGQTDPARVKPSLDETLSRSGWPYELYETTGDEDLKKIVGTAVDRGFELVIACGGDGTVSGVADGLAGSDIPLAILPTGTTNAFATALGIPPVLQDALELLSEGHQKKPVDAIKYHDRYFLLEASLGAFSASFEEVGREKKDRLGWLAYVDTAVRKWIGLDRLRMKIEVDGVRYAFHAAEVALFNTSQVGLIDEDLDADIRLDDGALDLYAVRSKNLWDLIRMLVYRMRGKPKHAPHMQYWRVKRSLRIDSLPKVSFQADGEVRGKTPAVFSVAPGVLRVIVPATGEGQ